MEKCNVRDIKDTFVCHSPSEQVGSVALLVHVHNPQPVSCIGETQWGVFESGMVSKNHGKSFTGCCINQKLLCNPEGIETCDSGQVLHG